MSANEASRLIAHGDFRTVKGGRHSSGTKRDDEMEVGARWKRDVEASKREVGCNEKRTWDEEYE